jgi:CrcB protein
MMRVLLVGLAGALGTIARYGISLAAGKALGAAFPYGTLVVNVLGCFLIAAVVQVSLTTSLISPLLRLTLTTGFMGGLTTYSAFNYETTTLLQNRAFGAAAVNFGATVAGCFLAGLLGLAVAQGLVKSG